MKNYLTFEQAINRVKYGTNINVTEAPLGKLIFSGKHVPQTRMLGSHKKRFAKDVLNADVTQFTVENGVLHIEIVRQEG